VQFEKEDPMTPDPSRLLRRALAVNAWITAANGLGFLVAGHVLGPIFGLAPAVLWVLGAFFLGFAAHAGAVARKETIARAEGAYFAIADAAYVLASVVVLVGFPHLMTGLGRLYFAAAADLVALFAIAEYAGLRRLTRASAAAAA
jgi:cation transport ATPase